MDEKYSGQRQVFIAITSMEFSWNLKSCIVCKTIRTCMSVKILTLLQQFLKAKGNVAGLHMQTYCDLQTTTGLLSLVLKSETPEVVSQPLAFRCVWHTYRVTGPAPPFPGGVLLIWRSLAGSVSCLWSACVAKPLVSAHLHPNPSDHSHGHRLPRSLQ